MISVWLVQPSLVLSLTPWRCMWQLGNGAAPPSIQLLYLMAAPLGGSGFHSVLQSHNTLPPLPVAEPSPAPLSHRTSHPGLLALAPR
jgi:hypothetical protein